MKDPPQEISFRHTLQIRLKSLRRCTQSPVFWLLLFTFLHGLWYAAIVHPWQAPDEYIHYEYVRGFLDQRTLDPFADGRDGPVQHELIESMLAFQHYRYRLAPTLPEDFYQSNPTPLGDMRIYPHPPLYYLLSAPLYALSHSASPLTQLYLLRIFSVLLQCATVWLTYKLAGLVFNTRSRPWLALFPAALIALLPQYTFISASYNNDNLVPPLVTAALFFLIRGYRQEANLRQFALAVIFGLLALMAKRTAVAIVPVLGLGLLGYARIWLQSENRWKRLSGAGTWFVAAIALILLAAFLIHPPAIPPALARLLRLNPNAFIQFSASLMPNGAFQGIDWRFFLSFMMESFWGWFGWLTVRVPHELYTLFTLLTAVLTLGLLGALGRHLREKESEHTVQVPFAMTLLLTGSLFTLAAMIALFMISPETFPPQGRYLFPFLPALSILGVWSWISFWPRRFQSAALKAAWLVLAIYDIYAWAFVLLPEWYS